EEERRLARAERLDGGERADLIGGELFGRRGRRRAGERIAHPLHQLDPGEPAPGERAHDRLAEAEPLDQVPYRGAAAQTLQRLVELALPRLAAERRLALHQRELPLRE